MIIAVTVTGKDRPGIVASLTEALFKAGGNLEDASMTILEGAFAMIFLCELKNASALKSFVILLKNLEKNFKLAVHYKEVSHTVIRGLKHQSGTNSWVVSVLGKDRAGIVYHVAKTLSHHGFNITDLNSRILGKGKKASYALILEVDVPRSTERINLIKKEFHKIQKKLRINISFNPLETSNF